MGSFFLLDSKDKTRQGHHTTDSARFLIKTIEPFQGSFLHPVRGPRRLTGKYIKGSSQSNPDKGPQLFCVITQPVLLLGRAKSCK